MGEDVSDFLHIDYLINSPSLVQAYTNEIY